MGWDHIKEHDVFNIWIFLGSSTEWPLKFQKGKNYSSSQESLHVKTA